MTEINELVEFLDKEIKEHDFCDKPSWTKESIFTLRGIRGINGITFSDMCNYCSNKKCKH